MAIEPHLPAESWLRLFRESPYPNFANVTWCERCARSYIYGWSEKTTLSPCIVCRQPVRRLDKTFWKKVSGQMKRAYRRDHSLFARIKAEFPGWPLPKLDEPLSWVNREWDKAGRPVGRPVEAEEHGFLAHWMAYLSDEQRIPEFPPGCGGMPTSEVQWNVQPPLMTREKAMGWLSGSQAFSDQARKRFGAEPPLDPRHVKRVIAWAKRMQSQCFRLTGRMLRPRKRRSAK